MVFDIPLGLNQNDEPILTGDSEYENPCRPYIRFMDRVTKATNYKFDGFTNNDINVTGLECNNAIGETGSATITLEDSSRDLDESLINWGSRVIIKIAKNQWEFAQPWSTFLIGYVKGYQKDRPETNVMNHIIQVQGSKVLFSERMINYKKTTGSNTNSAFQVKNHIKNILTTTDALPMKRGTTIQSQGGFDLSGIDTNLKTMVKSVNFELMEAGNAIQRLADIEGARWFVDFIGESEVLSVKYPTDLKTGITVLSGDLSTVSDPAWYTSKFHGHWDSQGDITGSTGFANRLWTKTQIEEKEFTSSFTNKNSMTLANKAIAQKFFITETRITDVAFILSKVGEPTSQNNRVNGRIIADNNNSPTGNIITSFNIPLDDIEKSPETIFVNDLDIKNRFVANAAPAWLVLYQRSGTEENDKSEPNNDEQNTIRWHHNNDITTVTTLPSKTASGGDREQNLSWSFIKASDKGPTFCFGVFAKIRHIQEVSDRGSIDRYGLVEAEVDTSFLDEPRIIQTYLQAQLEFTARPRLVFNTNKVRIPSNFLFKPYQIITLQDSLAYPDGIEAEIQRVSYNFNTEEFALGTRFASITPISYYDYLDERWKCT